MKHFLTLILIAFVYNSQAQVRSLFPTQEMEIDSSTRIINIYNTYNGIRDLFPKESYIPNNFGYDIYKINKGIRDLFPNKTVIIENNTIKTYDYLLNHKNLNLRSPYQNYNPYECK